MKLLLKWKFGRRRYPCGQCAVPCSNDREDLSQSLPLSPTSLPVMSDLSYNNKRQKWQKKKKKKSIWWHSNCQFIFYTQKAGTTGRQISIWYTADFSRFPNYKELERSVIFIVGTPQLWETESKKKKIQKITLYDFQIIHFLFLHEIIIWYNRKIGFNIWYRNLCL